MYSKPDFQSWLNIPLKHNLLVLKKYFSTQLFQEENQAGQLIASLFLSMEDEFILSMSTNKNSMPNEKLRFHQKKTKRTCRSLNCKFLKNNRFG